MLATCAFIAMSACCLHEWRVVAAELDVSTEVGGSACVELSDAAVVWATCLRGSVTRSSSPHLLARASVIEARWLGGDGRAERAAWPRQPGRASSAVQSSGGQMRGAQCGGG
jgi:hypothetical protein